MKNCALFCRVSTVEQTDAIQTHIDRGKAYAKSRGWKVKKVYELVGVSGKSTINHPKTAELFRDIELGLVDIVIISSLSRLARSTAELLEYARIFEEMNVSLISLNENLSSEGSGGKFMYSMLAALSQYEREIINERMQASLEFRRSKKLFTGGMVSYGYTIVDAQVIINEDEAPVRRLIYDLFLDLRRAKSVADELNNRGYVTRKGKPWSDVTIKRLLKNTDAKGLRRCNYRGNKTYENPSGFKPQSEWQYLPCPALIPEEKWEEVQTIIRNQERNSRYKQPLNHIVNVYTGYLKCAKGHALSIKSKSKRYTCAKCRIGIHKDDLEDVFLTRLKKFLDSNDELSEYGKSNAREIQIKSDEIEFAETKLKKLEERLDRLVDLNLSGEIPSKGFKKHYEPIFERKEKLLLATKDLHKELKQLKLAKDAVEDVTEKSLKFYNNWENLDRGEKRSVVEVITNEIIFDGKTLIFRLKQVAPLSSLELTPNGSQRGTIS